MNLTIKISAVIVARVMPTMKGKTLLGTMSNILIQIFFSFLFELLFFIFGLNNLDRMVASGQRMFTKRTSNDVADYLFSFETTKPS